jgi:hypothetical protein
MRSSIAALLFLLLAAACTPVPQESSGAAQSLSSAECTARGGAMRPVGRMQSVRCVIRYADAGKRCTDGGQCRGDCRAEPSDGLREGAPAAGVCQAENVRFGCFTTIEGGKAEATICID